MWVICKQAVAFHVAGEEFSVSPSAMYQWIAEKFKADPFYAAAVSHGCLEEFQVPAQAGLSETGSALEEEVAVEERTVRIRRKK